MKNKITLASLVLVFLQTTAYAGKSPVAQCFSKCSSECRSGNGTHNLDNPDCEECFNACIYDMMANCRPHSRMGFRDDESGYEADADMGDSESFVGRDRRTWSPYPYDSAKDGIKDRALEKKYFGSNLPTIPEENDKDVLRDSTNTRKRAMSEGGVKPKKPMLDEVLKSPPSSPDQRPMETPAPNNTPNNTLITLRF